MTKKHKLNIVSGIFYFSFGLIGLLIRGDVINYFEVLNPLFVTFIPVVFILTGIVLILFVYLQGGLSNELQSMDNTSNNLKKQFDDLKVELYSYIEENSKNEIDETFIKENVSSKIDGITSNILFEKIENKYDKKITDDLKQNQFEIELNYIKNTIDREIMRSSRNSSINLSIGFFTTFIAIFFLGYSLLGYVDITYTSTTSFVLHFIPRLSLSLFIELFSFFFLRLYKKNLDDIKYLNNERTNIDLKLIALRASILYKDTEALKDVILKLSQTERNFVLKKGESTVEIEKEKNSNNNTEQILSGLLKLVNKK